MTPDPFFRSKATRSARPGRGWYGLAMVIFLVGVAAFTASINVGRARVEQMTAQLQRIRVPGGGLVSIDQPGNYVVYYEKAGTFKGEPFNTRDAYPVLPKMTLTMQSQATGRFAQVAPATRSDVIDHGRAHSEWVVQFDEAGTYRVEAQPQGQLTQELVLSVGRPVAGALLSAWKGPFGGAAVLAFAFVIAAVMGLITWMLRHKQTLRAQARGDSSNEAPPAPADPPLGPK